MEEYFQPNTAICCANQEEFTELCEVLTDAGFRIGGTTEGPNPYQYSRFDVDSEAGNDAIYICHNGHDLMYTSKYYSMHGDDDHPTVIDFCDIFHKRIEISSIDELL